MKPQKNDFDAWIRRVDERIKQHPLEMIYWEATRNCDIKCVHCGSPLETWEKDSELSSEEVLNAFAEIYDTFDLSQFKFISITGGEPFVRKDLFEILKGLKKIGYSVITIQTNGNYLARHPEDIGLLLELNIKGLGTNLDGLESTHDSFRNMKGSYANVVKMSTTLNNNYRDKIHSTISTVVSRKNINELENLSKIVREINPHRWRLMPFDPIGRGSIAENYLLNSSDYKVLFDFIAKERLEYIDRQDLTQIEFGCGGWLGLELEGRIRPYIWHCVAGINTLGLLYDGGIAGCSNIPRAFIEGNLRADKILDVWNNRYRRFREFDWKKMGDCIDCSQWDYCHGGPMHKRVETGEMLNCLFKMFYEGKEYCSHTSETLY
jgi:radical SAM protein with 4Fe4S-binding SPASM domain